MSMKDLLGKLARIDESMTSAAKKPTGPKFVGKWKGTDPASAAKNKLVGGGCEESILHDLEKALTETPARDLRTEWTLFKESTDEFVLYVNDKPAAKYTKLSQATQDVALLKNRVPSAKLEIKQEVCKLIPVGITEAFIQERVSEGEVIQFPKREVKPQEKKPEAKKDNVKAISKDRYAKTAHNTMQGPNIASIYESENDELVRQVIKLANFYNQSENLKSMFSLEEYIYKKMGVQPKELAESFKSKQEVIDHFVKQGKPAAAGAAAWERGWRGQQAKPTNMKDFKFKNPPSKNWQELDEYGGTGGYGAASQAPTGTTAQAPDPAAQQLKLDQQQIQKSTNNIAGTLNQQGAAQPLNKTKFSDVLTKLDAEPNTNLSAQELQQMGPMAVAASKALQNPQTATQMKQLISKADTMDKQKELKVQQAQQKTGTNPPSGQPTTQPTVPGQTK